MSNVIEIGLDLAKDLLEGKIRDVLGIGDKKLDLSEAVKANLEERAQKIVRELKDRFEDEARQMVYVFSLAFEIRDVADQVAEVPKAFEPPAHPKSIPSLLDITEIGPDEKLEETTVEPVDEKFDGGGK